MERERTGEKGTERESRGRNLTPLNVTGNINKADMEPKNRTCDHSSLDTHHTYDPAQGRCTPTVMLTTR